MTEVAMKPTSEEHIPSIQCCILISHFHYVQIQILESPFHHLRLEQGHKEKYS